MKKEMKKKITTPMILILNHKVMMMKRIYKSEEDDLNAESEIYDDK